VFFNNAFVNKALAFSPQVLYSRKKEVFAIKRLASKQVYLEN
jgi:hypothetical protein